MRKDTKDVSRKAKEHTLSLPYVSTEISVSENALDEGIYSEQGKPATLHSDLFRALQVLPAGDRFMPSWCALRYLRMFASPLHKAILQTLNVPEQARHGLWAEIARKFNLHARTIYRHRDEYLLPEITRLTAIFTITFLMIHQKWADAEKIFTYLKNPR